MGVDHQQVKYIYTVSTIVYKYAHVLYTHIHAQTTYVHTYIHTYILYIHSYKRTYIHILLYLNTYVHTNIRIRIYTLQVYMYVRVCACKFCIIGISTLYIQNQCILGGHRGYKYACVYIRTYVQHIILPPVQYIHV